MDNCQGKGATPTVAVTCTTRKDASAGTVRTTCRTGLLEVMEDAGDISQGVHPVRRSPACPSRGVVAWGDPSCHLITLTSVDAITERIVFDESVRVLASQEEVLAGLRARGGTLLAAASLVTAFLAPAAFGAEVGGAVAREFDGWAWGATAAFVGVVGATLVVLWPYEWVFGHSSHDLMDKLLDPKPPADEATVLRHLAYYNDVNHTANADKLGWLFLAFALGCVLLAAEIMLWLRAVAS